MVLNFLAAALQSMPEDFCLLVLKKLQRLLEVEDATLKTHAYLTIEVLFASRKLFKFRETIESLLTQLL